MPLPTPAAVALSARYRLAVGTTPRGGVPGERLGHGTGSSLEFEDRRPYSVGDDIRHLDWRAYARTDQPMVQVFREEVTPRLEIYLDATASMGVDPGKAQLALDLVAILGECARADGYATKLLVLADGVREVAREEFLAEETQFAGVAPLLELVRAARPLTQSGSVRVLVSDFLVEDGVARIARELAGRAGRIAFLQVLAAFDRHPPADSALRLVDAEDGTFQDLVLDAPTLRLYRGRLERLLDSVRQAVHRTGGLYALVSGDESAALACDQALCRAGLLAPAG